MKNYLKNYSLQTYFINSLFYPKINLDSSVLLILPE